MNVLFSRMNLYNLSAYVTHIRIFNKSIQLWVIAHYMQISGTNVSERDISVAAARITDAKL